jgi:hypothetical protein
MYLSIYLSIYVCMYVMHRVWGGFGSAVIGSQP